MKDLGQPPELLQLDGCTVEVCWHNYSLVAFATGPSLEEVTLDGLCLAYFTAERQEFHLLYRLADGLRYVSICR